MSQFDPSHLSNPKMNPSLFRTARLRANSFTLVEVCLSLGILAITLVPLIALMANGLVHVRSNLDTIQQEFTAAKNADFYTLSNETGYIDYYTAEGDLALIPQTSVFAAIVTCTTTPTTQANAAMPQPPLVTVTISVVRSAGNAVTPGTGTTLLPIVSFVGAVSCPDVSKYTAGT
jgi:hypothetical protein